MAKQNIDSWRGSRAYWSKLASIYYSKLRADPKSNIFFPLAEAQASLGKVEEAIITLEDGLALRSASRGAKVFLAKLRYKQGDIKIAKSILENVLDETPDLTSAVFMMCKIYEQEGKYKSAKKIAMGLANYYPDSEIVQSLVKRYSVIPYEDNGRKRKISDAVVVTCELSQVDRLKTMLDRITWLKKEESRQYETCQKEY